MNAAQPAHIISGRRQTRSGRMFRVMMRLHDYAEHWILMGRFCNEMMKTSNSPIFRERLQHASERMRRLNEHYQTLWTLD